MSVCLSVCVSVTRRYCVKTVKHRITQTAPRDSPGTLVFGRQESLVDDPFPEICAQGDPPPFRTHNFNQYPFIAFQPWELAKKVQLAHKSTTRFPTSHRWTVYVTPKSPKGWHKNAILLFLPVKSNFCRKKSATKFFFGGSSSHITETAEPKVVKFLYTDMLYQF